MSHRHADLQLSHFAGQHAHAPVPQRVIMMSARRTITSYFSAPTVVSINSFTHAATDRSSFVILIRLKFRASGPNKARALSDRANLSSAPAAASASVWSLPTIACTCVADTVNGCTGPRFGALMHLLVKAGGHCFHRRGHACTVFETVAARKMCEPRTAQALEASVKERRQSIRQSIRGSINCCRK
jgi:hypothetical protein